MPEAFLVMGASGHAKVVIDALLASGNRIVGCYDDDESLAGTDPVPGVTVVGGSSALVANWRKGQKVVIAIGENRIRLRLSLLLKVEYGIASAPSVVLGKGVTIGPGSMLLPSATVNIDSAIGMHAILNTSCSVDHDCRIGDFAHIAPGCALGGNITVGEGTFLGVGTRVIPGIRIGRWSIVGAGAVVTKDLPDNCTAVGVPAKVIKTREDGWHLK
jgi:sugar O-acyltransferase (sialic acid O-acetyltransferase NeuD family)